MESAKQLPDDPNQTVSPDNLQPPVQVPYEWQADNLALEVAEGDSVAWGWSAWSATDEGFEPAEFYALEQDRRRVQGVRSEKRYDACLRQVIKVIPNLTFTFSLEFQVDPSHADPNRARPAGLVVGVGLDPTGNTDPRADSVRWALRDLPYSQTVLASVTADTLGEVATLFVRSVAFLPGSNTTVANGNGDQCKTVCQQNHYRRTYLLLPPNASTAMWERAARTAARNRWTMGGSADDAGLGAALLTNPAEQDSKPIVKAIHPSAWQNPQALQGLTATWFETHYPPGVKFEALTLNDLDL